MDEVAVCWKMMVAIESVWINLIPCPNAYHWSFLSHNSSVKVSVKTTNSFWNEQERL